MSTGAGQPQKKMTIRDRWRSFAATHDKVRAVEDHVVKHQTAYAAAGIAVGLVIMLRLTHRPVPVNITNTVEPVFIIALPDKL